MRTFSRVLTMCALAPVIFDGSIQAQRAAHRLGVVVGPSFARFGGGDAADGLESRTTWFAGAFAEFAISRRFVLVPELLYTQKGARESHPDFTGAIKLSYIEVPVLVGVRFPSSSTSPRALTPHLHAGPAVAFRTSCTLDGSGDPVPVNGNCVDFADPGVEFNSLDVSGIVAGGLDVGRLGVGLRYVHGFMRIQNQSDARNRVLSVYATYGLHVR